MAQSDTARDHLFQLFTALNTRLIFKKKTHSLTAAMNLTIAKDQILNGLQAVQNVVSPAATPDKPATKLRRFRV